MCIAHVLLELSWVCIILTCIALSDVCQVWIVLKQTIVYCSLPNIYSENDPFILFLLVDTNLFFFFFLRWRFVGRIVSLDLIWTSQTLRRSSMTPPSCLLVSSHGDGGVREFNPVTRVFDSKTFSRFVFCQNYRNAATAIFGTWTSAWLLSY